MRIECPYCEAVYRVPDGVYVPGRTVRCARCKHDWKPAADAPDRDAADRDAADRSPEGRHVRATPGLPPPMAAEPPPPLDDSTGSPVSRSRRRAVLAAWAGSLLILGAAGGSAIAWRQPVMRAWPPAARLFAALQLD